MSQHSKAPWRAFRSSPPDRKGFTPPYPESERTSIHASFKIADDDQTAGNDMCRGNLIAHIYNHDPQGTMEANARLIAAAPELLEMLEKIFDAEFGFGGWPTEAEIRAVIDKAKGE